MRSIPLLLLVTACGLDPWWADPKDNPSPVHDTTDGPGDTWDPVDTGGQGGTGATNHPPVADAGDDQEVQVTGVVQLDGGGSSDPDDDDLDYQWELVSVPSGSGVTLLNDDRMDPVFTADTPGEFRLRLVVFDGEYDSAPDEVVITATAADEVPVANAGVDQSVNVGTTVQLDGTGSFDPEGDPLTYAWTMSGQPSGSTATLSSSTASRPLFVSDGAGQYLIDLRVSDGVNTSTSDRVIVSASDSSGGSDCLGCRMSEVAARQRLGMLLLLPLLLGWRRRWAG